MTPADRARLATLAGDMRTPAILVLAGLSLAGVLVLAAGTLAVVAVWDAVL